MLHSIRQAGFTLIEVLIALIVLSIGLLGLAGMQLGGLRSNTDAYHRTQATLLAYEMADRMRANMAGVRNGNYNNITSTKPADPGCISTGCNVEQLGRHDTFAWLAGLQNTLPAGRGTVAVSAADNAVFIITVMWDEARSGATGESCSGAVGELQCLSVNFQP